MLTDWIDALPVAFVPVVANLIAVDKRLDEPYKAAVRLRLSRRADCSPHLPVVDAALVLRVFLPLLAQTPDLIDRVRDADAVLRDAGIPNALCVADRFIAALLDPVPLGNA